MQFTFKGLVAAALAVVAVGSPVTNPELYGNTTQSHNATLDYTIQTAANALSRHEVPWFVTCARFNKVLYKQWIVQIPPSWWKHKHKTEAAACDQWNAHINSNLHAGGVIWQECFDMGDKQHRSGKPHYLHMRFTSTVWIRDTKVEGAIWEGIDQHHWKDMHQYNALQVACAGYSSHCPSRWKHGNRCYQENGALHGV